MFGLLPLAAVLVGVLVQNEVCAQEATAKVRIPLGTKSVSAFSFLCHGLCIREPIPTISIFCRRSPGAPKSRTLPACGPLMPSTQAAATGLKKHRARE
jgi:hypothetical protein